MNDLSKALAEIKSDTITGSQTFFIDEVLACAGIDQIPIDDTSSVITYIDLQLAHNKVSQEIRDGLTILYSELLLRSSKA